MGRVILGTGRLYESVSVVFLFVLILSVAVQIVMRNFFDSGSAALEELARFSLISGVFLMIPALTLAKKQIVVDVVLMHLPAYLRRILDLVIDLICAAFGVFILCAIALIMEQNWSVRTPAMRLPNAIFYLPVFLGMVLFTLASLYDFARILKGEGAVA
jgi:TRAP-type transport system small permease protein